MQSLTLKAGGVLHGLDQLVLEDRVLFETDKTGKLVDDIRTHLQRTLLLDGELKLIDLFRLFRGRQQLQNIFGQLGAKDQLDEVLRYSENATSEAMEGIEYLEFYQMWKKNSKTGQVFIDRRLHCQAVGFELKEDLVIDGVVIQKKFSRFHKDVRFVPIRKLLNLPIHVNPVVPIYEVDEENEAFGEEVSICLDEAPTLYTLLSSVLAIDPRYGCRQTPSYEVMQIPVGEAESPLQDVLKEIFAPEPNHMWVCLFALAALVLVMIPPFAANYLLT